jgi:hypothetical protein
VNFCMLKKTPQIEFANRQYSLFEGFEFDLEKDPHPRRREVDLRSRISDGTFPKAGLGELELLCSQIIVVSLSKADLFKR